MSGNREEAERLKEQGNILYKRRRYMQALDKYGEALRADPTYAAPFGNRAACFMQLEKYDDAIAECEKALEVDPTYLRILVRMAKAYVALGRFRECLERLEPFRGHDDVASDVAGEIGRVANLQTYFDGGLQALAIGNNDEAIRKIESIVPSAVKDSTVVSVAHALCYVAKREFSRAKGILNSRKTVVQERGNTAEVDVLDLVLRLVHFYDNGNMDSLSHWLQNKAQLSPDCHLLRTYTRRMAQFSHIKAEGNTHFQAKEYQEAIGCYTRLLVPEGHRMTFQDSPSILLMWINQAIQGTHTHIDSLYDQFDFKNNSRLYSNRAACFMGLEDYSAALHDADNSLRADPTFMKALSRRASCYVQLGKYEEAVTDLERLSKETHDPKYRRELQQAQALMRSTGKKDYYKILGVEKDASEKEIKSAYRKMARSLHPDRTRGLPDRERAEAEDKFRDANEAFEILSDPQKRRNYDAGISEDGIPIGGMGGMFGGPGGIDLGALFGMMGGGMPGMGGMPGGGNVRFSFGGPGGSMGSMGGINLQDLFGNR